MCHFILKHFRTEQR